MAGAEKTELYAQFARLAKALGNGKRLELVDLLAQGERSVETLALQAGMGLTTVSAHLQALRRVHVVTTRREGTRVYYRLAGDDIVALYALLRSVAADRVPEASRAATDYLGPETSGVGRAELLTRAEHGEVTVLDVRPYEEYTAGHIPGAVSIPLDELTDRVDELPAHTEVVAYCRGAYCVLAHDAVRLLTTYDRSASRLSEGILEWRLAGLPITSDAA